MALTRFLSLLLKQTFKIKRGEFVCRYKGWQSEIVHLPPLGRFLNCRSPCFYSWLSLADCLSSPSFCASTPRHQARWCKPLLKKKHVLTIRIVDSLWASSLLKICGIHCPNPQFPSRELADWSLYCRHIKILSHFASIKKLKQRRF